MKELARRIRSKGNNLLAEVSMRTGLRINKPTYVCAKMTTRCNSRCLHCNIWKMESDESELTTEQWCAALDRLSEWLGRFRMAFTGGETLLRGDMPEILGHAVARGIEVELLSNGLLIDMPLAQRIVATGITQFTTPFDGIREGTHDRFRGGSGFHAQTLRAIKALDFCRSSRETPLKILLKTVISSNNLEELVAIAAFAHERGLEVIYQPIEQNYGEEPNPHWYRRSSLWIRDLALLRREMARLQNLKRRGYPIANSLDDLNTIVRYFERPDKLMGAVQAHDTRTAAGNCRHAVTNFVISSNGDVRMCFWMGPIGNILDAFPRDIWNKRGRCWTGPCACR